MTRKYKPDTVNTASLLGSHGAPGRTHVSETVFERLQGRFAFEARETIKLKSRGPMNTYFLDAPTKLKNFLTAVAQSLVELLKTPVIPNEKFALVEWHACTVTLLHKAAKPSVDFQRFTIVGDNPTPSARE